MAKKFYDDGVHGFGFDVPICFGVDGLESCMKVWQICPPTSRSPMPLETFLPIFKTSRGCRVVTAMWDAIVNWVDSGHGHRPASLGVSASDRRSKPT